MKKLVFCLSAFVICLLSSCAMDPGRFNYDYDALLEEVVQIELVQYENPDQKHFRSWVPNHFPDLVPFIPQNMTKLEDLEESKKNDFLNQLSQSDILSTYYAYNSPKGICIRLVYTNGDFEILNCNVEKRSAGGYIGRYTSEGEIVDFKGVFSNNDSYQSLVNDYFTMSI